MKKNNIDWSVDVDCYDETQGKRLFNKVTKIAQISEMYSDNMVQIARLYDENAALGEKSKSYTSSIFTVSL